MDNKARAEEYAFIREEQLKLRRSLKRLDERIALLRADDVAVPGVAPVNPAARKEDQFSLPVPTPFAENETPPPLPMFRPPLFSLQPQPVVAPLAAVTPVEEPPSSAFRLPPSAFSESWEVRIGTTWLVRAGVVLLLTSLAFLGAYLYQHVVPRLGSVPKVALLYLASGALAGAGAWLERRRANAPDEEAVATGGLRQYGRVVLAGGLAAVYYVTYAAHWNPHLRVVANPVGAGGLLLAWTAFMVFLAHRRSSETLATFAILMAFYTSAINEIAGFTLFSNLALTIAAVFLLRRHLWTVFPFASLLASFGSYGFWRYFHVYSAWRGRAEFPSPAIGGFWIEATFLAIYWLLFTWVVFAPGEKTLVRARESVFAGLNNGAFFALGTWALLADRPGSFWRWALGFGVVLTALGETARRLSKPLDPRTEATYQTGGILLVTWGIVTCFTGWHLSLTLAVESAALLAAAGRRGSRLLLAASCATAFLAFLWALDWLDTRTAPSSWVASAAAGGLLVSGAWWSQRLRESAAPLQPGAAVWEKFRGWLTHAPTWYSLLGSFVWYGVIVRNVPEGVWMSSALLLTGVALTAAVPLLRVRALGVFAQFHLLVAVLFSINDHASSEQALRHPPWIPVLIIAGILAVGHWWQGKQRETFFPASKWRLIVTLDAVFIVLVLVTWLGPAKLNAAPDIWIAESAALSLLLLWYGLYSRYFSLAVAGQAFLVLSVQTFYNLWDRDWDGNPTEAFCALAPIVGALAVLTVGTRFAPAATPSLQTRWKVAALIYEAVVVFLAVAWGERYFPHLEKFALFCLTGGLIFAFGVLRKATRWLGWGGLPVLAGLATYWGIYNQREEAAVVQWVGIVVLASAQRLGRRQLPAGLLPNPAQSALMILATAVAWTWVGAAVSNLRLEGTFTVAAGWSLFAAVVFAAGFAWRESTYRWLGLVILACTVGRIAVYDIWQLDSLGRILSSFALGLVLLGIAFVYIKFQSQVKKLF